MTREILVIVGLGNPGQKYSKNRHNAGFLILDSLANASGTAFSTDQKLNSETAKLRNFKGHDVLLVKPLTFMNESGTAASKVLAYFKIDPQKLLVIHDDVDLKPMHYKEVFGSSSAGHHGVEDIIEKLGTKDFSRLRIGVGRPTEDPGSVEDYVLRDFSSAELEFLSKLATELMS